MQVPALHTASAAQVWLQAPQCSVLVWVSTQRGAAPVAVHSVRPLAVPQLVQLPPAQVPP